MTSKIIQESRLSINRKNGLISSRIKYFKYINNMDRLTYIVSKLGLRLD